MKKTQPNALLHSNSDTALSTKKYITAQDALKPRSVQIHQYRRITRTFISKKDIRTFEAISFIETKKKISAFISASHSVTH